MTAYQTRRGTITQQELDNILVIHQKWLDGGEKDHERADLSHVDLRGLDLRSARLRKAIIRKSNLSGVDLHEMDLSAANLSHTEFTGCNLRGAILRDADLREPNSKTLNCAMRTYAERHCTRSTSLPCTASSSASLQGRICRMPNSLQDLANSTLWGRLPTYRFKPGLCCGLLSVRAFFPLSPCL